MGGVGTGRHSGNSRKSCCNSFVSNLIIERAGSNYNLEQGPAGSRRQSAWHSTGKRKRTLIQLPTSQISRDKVAASFFSLNSCQGGAQPAHFRVIRDIKKAHLRLLGTILLGSGLYVASGLWQVVCL